MASLASKSVNYMGSELNYAAALGGATVYFLYFHRGERHLYPWRYVFGHLVLSGLLVASILRLEPRTETVVAVRITANISVAYLSGLYLSLIFWRLCLNPLNRFPGPFMARLTAFRHTFRLGKKDMYLKLYEDHKKLGKFVRIGPNDISVSDADVLRLALSAQSQCIKAPWYSVEHPAESMHSTRSRVVHDKRRRIWSPAFSDKALRGYELRMKKYNESVLQQVESSSGKEVDVSMLFNFWSFDVMGDLAFGRSFDMLSSGSEHWAIELLNKSQDAAGFAIPIWVARLLLSIPGLKASYWRFLGFCAKRIDERIQMQGKLENPDITHFLIDDYLSKTKEEQRMALRALHLDSKLIIVAGSDTTAATMTFLWYYIASRPEVLARLREEIDPLVGADGTIEHHSLQSAAYLQGCINETLRLHPPVPSGIYRKTPAEGLHVGEQWIPGNTIMQLHLYSIGRDNSHFVQADQFIPERHSTRAELIKHKDAFAPFSMGPFNCIGKSLAQMEIRLLAAHLITKYDVSFAPGEDGVALLSQSTDHFTINPAPLKLRFTKRA